MKKEYLKPQTEVYAVVPDTTLNDVSLEAKSGTALELNSKSVFDSADDEDYQ